MQVESFITAYNVIIVSWRPHLVITPADTEPLVPVVFPPGPAGLHLRPPDPGVTLALAAGRVEPVHTLLSAPIGAPAPTLRK